MKKVNLFIVIIVVLVAQNVFATKPINNLGRLVIGKKSFQIKLRNKRTLNISAFQKESKINLFNNGEQLKLSSTRSLKTDMFLLYRKTNGQTDGWDDIDKIRTSHKASWIYVGLWAGIGGLLGVIGNKDNRAKGLLTGAALFGGLAFLIVL